VIVAVADTHVAIWYLFKNPKLSITARQAIEAAFRGREQIGVSAISLIEMVYLVEKGRIPADSFDRLVDAMASPRYPFREIAVNSAVAAQMRQVDRDEIPDMPDRIIAATGLYHRVPVISRDGKIRAANLTTIW
jgi:PIN domain nuclease of toxin-antitoxin system